LISSNREIFTKVPAVAEGVAAVEPHLIAREQGFRFTQKGRMPRTRCCSMSSWKSTARIRNKKRSGAA